jgi:hypothetical protein
LVKTCRDYPYAQWDKYAAARDLLAREAEGCFDKSVELEGHNSSTAMWVGGGGRPWGIDQLTLNHRELVTYAKTSKVSSPGTVKLPSPVDVPADEVLRGYFPEEGHVWIGSKFNWGETHKREYWLEHLFPKDWQYFVPNYMKPYRRRLRTSIRERQWIVVEADKWSLEQQFWIHRQLAKHLPLGCLCGLAGRACMVAIGARELAKKSWLGSIDWQQS